MEHSKYYDFWEMCYKNKYVELGEVKEAVIKNIVTKDEFKTITGQDYIA